MSLIPDLLQGPLRVGSSATTVDILLAEPLVFAAHYATVASVLNWPESVQASLEAVRQRYSAHDEVLKLMDTLRGQVAMPLSIELTRHMAEGLELHGMMRRTPETYRRVCQNAAARIDSFMAQEADDEDNEELTSSGRLARLARLMDFSAAETRVLSFALGMTLSSALQCFTRLFVEQRRTRGQVWQVLLDLPLAEIGAALSVRGRLAGSGLLQEKDGIPHLAEFWTELLVKTALGLDEQLVEPLPQRESTAGAARLPEVDREILLSLLVRREAGINVLMHGKATVDKLQLARELVSSVQGTAYGLAAEIPDSESPRLK